MANLFKNSIFFPSSITLCLFFAYFNQRPIFQIQNFNFLFCNFNQNTSLILQLLHSLFSSLFPILIVYYLFWFFFSFCNMNDLYWIKVRQIWGSTPYWVIYDYKLFYFSLIFLIYSDNFSVIFTIIDRLLFMWLFIYLFIYNIRWILQKIHPSLTLVEMMENYWLL